MAANRILLVEDEDTLLEALRYNLVKEGYEVSTATDGVQAIELAHSEKPDVIILDIMLPKLDGFEVCRILRKDMTVPILMLTAKESEIDKVVGLELGADDYMTKPFSMRELLARVRAMLRRAMMTEKEQGEEEPMLEVDDLVIDLAKHQANLKGSPLNLTRKEFDLLAFLVKNRNIVFSRAQILEKVWGYEYFGGDRTVDVHIRWLREKIEVDPAHPKHLLTVRGVGYRFEG
ncbi:MAG: DNA-binding response regulator [Chloroflexi bacterium RBG_13_54_9]|nr:MAG: DNA-binding response regulator [Chloroflexi bacterium RBG_13_54_9]